MREANPPVPHFSCIATAVALLLAFSAAPVLAGDITVFPSPDSTLKSVISSTETDLAPPEDPGNPYVGNGGYGKSRYLSGNHVTVNDGEVPGSVFGAYFHSQDEAPVVSHNRVTVNGGLVKGSVYGGFAQSMNSTVTASNNTVTVNAGTIEGNVIGGGGKGDYISPVSHASNNTVIIRGGEVLGDYVSGGLAISDYAESRAVNNTVIVSAGRIAQNVYGGRTHGTGPATGNSVIISGSPEFGMGTGLSGGYSSAPSSDMFSGNTLSVWNYSGSSVAIVRNFENFSFVFPASQSTPVLIVDAVAPRGFFLGDGFSKSSTVTASTTGGSAPLQNGTPVTLVQGNITTSGIDYTRATGFHGATLQYEWSLSTTDNLVATLQGTRARAESKALSEGSVSALALLNQGVDLISWRGIPMAAEAAKEGGTGAFGAISGGRSRYNTGSHAKMNSMSLLMGVACGTNFSGSRRMTLGGFIEYGNASYDTWNAFASSGISGEGRAYYFGIGTLARVDLEKRFYTEGSLRFGKVHNRHNTGLTDGMNNEANYRSSSPYVSVHLGVGHILNLNDTTGLDVYGKYFFTHQGSDSVMLTTNDPVDFNAVNSHRVRAGVRFNRNMNENAYLYAGAAGEYEFDGKARAGSYGYDFDAPSLRGSTGIVEFGVVFQPSGSSPLTIDAGLKGYVGKREGVIGSLRLKYEF